MPQQAGNAAARFLGLTPVARVLPVEPDEPQVTAAKDLLRTQRQVQQLVTGGISSAFASLMGSGSGSGSGRSSSADISSPEVAVAAPAAAEQQSLSLLQQDERLQELLRDEVVEQVAQQDSVRKQQQEAGVQ